jgi:DNA-binding response OmpR family regulator
MSTILVVDHDEVLTYSIARQMRKAGYEVSRVNSTMTALAVLDSKRIDLILTDLVVRKGQPSGLELGRMARMRCPHMKIIFMTNRDVLQRYRQLVPARVFCKPLNLESLAVEITAQLSD